MATLTRSPISPMCGLSPATQALAIQTGSWLAPEAPTDAHRFGRLTAACCALGLLWSSAAMAAHPRLAGKSAAKSVARPAPEHLRHLPYPRLVLPLQISGSQYEPLAWTDVAGWGDDDHLAAYNTFRASCMPIAAQ